MGAHCPRHCRGTGGLTLREHPIVYYVYDRFKSCENLWFCSCPSLLRALAPFLSASIRPQRCPQA